MRIHALTAMTALAIALAGCAGTTAQRPTTELATGGSCSGLDDADRQVAALYAGKVSNVKPIHETTFVARAIQPRHVAGAKFTVPAERGVTAAYLERTLSCHAVASSAAGHPNDPLRVEGIRNVNVRERGPAFEIAVTGVDRDAGKAILERARALESQGSRIEVQQIAASAPAHAAL
jgi:hypothetical protein